MSGFYQRVQEGPGRPRAKPIEGKVLRVYGQLGSAFTGGEPSPYSWMVEGHDRSARYLAGVDVLVCIDGGENER